MTDPNSSKYDTTPYDPKKATGNDSGGGSQALGNTDSPELKVVWDKRPSFNEDPPVVGGSGGSDSSEVDISAAGAFGIGFSALGAAVNSMLGTSQTLVKEYEDLKAKAMGGMDTVFGQHSKFKSDYAYDMDSRNFAVGTAGNSISQAVSTQKPQTETDFAEPARQFADSMNPMQKKALQQIGATLENVGEYIALVNRIGQMYAQSDRQSWFPGDFPASPPTQSST
ncbi:MAG TPA: hypothetical protein VGP70_01800 [Actinomadura sp.]|jgi:hypothetical protein|nr:hypothetical protein [Actinomadura sp.]